MSSVFFLAFLTFAGQTSLGNPATAIARGLPINTRDLLVRWPAGCICRDGAAWLFWWQSPLNPDRAHPDQPVPADCGIFCRLVSANGQDILLPRRVIVPESYKQAALEIEPGIVNAVAMPDGGAMLFLVNGTVIDGKPTTKTEALRIDQSGNLHTIVDIGDGIIYGAGRGPGPEGIRPAFEAQFWWDHSQNLCFLSSVVRDTSVLYARLDVRKGSPVVLDTRMWYYPRKLVSVPVHNKAQPNRMRQVLKRAPSAHDYLLRLCHSSTKAAGVEVAPDTFLFVDGPSPRNMYDTSRSSASTAEGMFVYRLRAADLSLIDSLSVPTSAVAGVDYDGTPLTQACLIRDTSGFQFVVPMADGNAGYRLDRRGRPVMGARSSGTVLEATAEKLKDYQALSFRPVGIEPDWQVDWFGFTDQGQPCHASAENRPNPSPGR